MNRKKLTNNEKFVFNETEFVNPRGNRNFSERSSIQKRLFPKTETNKPSSNPLASLSPPYTPTRSSHVDELGPNGDYSIKKDPITDPCVEEVVEKLAMLNTESLRITVNVNDDAQLRRIQMFPTNPCPPANSKKVLLQVVPKSTSASEKILHPFKADYKKTDVSLNDNSVLNNNKILAIPITNKPKEISTWNEKEAAIKPSPLTWKAPVMFQRGSTPEDEAIMQELIRERNVLQNDEPDEDSCICVRPLKLILCPVCSYTTTGRLRKTCQVHPKDVYLLDLAACPRCKETNKFILKEYDLPKGFKEVINNQVA